MLNRGYQYINTNNLTTSIQIEGFAGIDNVGRELVNLTVLKSNTGQWVASTATRTVEEVEGWISSGLFVQI